DGSSTSFVAGNVPKLSITSVTLVGTGTVSGLPVEGNALTTNESLTLAAATFTEGSSVGTVTKQVGSTNILMASVKLTNTTSGSDAKKVQMERLTFYNFGTAADADVGSFKLKYNNVVVATAPMVNKYINFDLSACGDDCLLDKGSDRTFDVYADLTAGSSRTIDLGIQYATHTAVKDVTNGVYITPTGAAISTDNTALTNTVTVSQGKVNVTKVNNVPAGNIPKNATNVELASWNFNVIGEPIDFQTLAFKITTTGNAKPEMLDSLILYNAAGTALIGSTDGVGATAASVGWATSTDTFTLNPGDNILTLKGTVDNSSALVSGDTFQLGIGMANTANFVAKGVNSSLTITLGTYATPSSVVSANTKTVQTSALVVTTLGSPAARAYAPGTNDVVLAKVSFDATASTEDIKISQVKATDVISAAFPIDLQNIRLWVDKDGDSYNGSGSLVALTEVVAGSTNSAANETFTWNLSGDDQFIVKAGKKVVMEIRANITGGATAGTHTVSIATADWVTGTGQTTKTQVTETISSATSNAVTVGTAGGNLQVSLSSSNPSAKLFAGGTTVTLAAFNFLATTTEDVELDYLYLTQLNTTAASSSATGKDYDEIWFEDVSGNEIAGTRMSPTSTKPYVDFTENAFVVPTTKSSGVTLYLKAKLAAIGTNNNGRSGNYVGYKINVKADVVAKGDQSGSGSYEYLGTTAPTGNTNYVYAAYPVFSKETLSTTKLTNGTRDLFKYKVTAVNGDISLGGFTFDITTTTAVLAASTLYVYDVTEATEVQVNGTGSGGGENAYQFTATGAVWNTTSTDWATAYPNYEIVVPVGTPHTFVLRGNITGATTGASVSVGLAGDSALMTGAATLMLSQANVNAQLHNDFIWSDSNASGHAYTTADWTNGYLVSGLSSTTSTLETVAY
ncbi:MAG: hypothetical protein HY974_04550, partial [Candidatus Kerfeldbacteria bacterium]|nr:hypothetical protein [Candidatus Kerfeldbacteria bacterium]